MQVITPQVFGLFDAISLLASIFSLVLAILAIWLSMVFKRDTDKTNIKTLELLVELRAEAKSIAENLSKELHEYGTAMRAKFLNNTAVDNTAVTLPNMIASPIGSEARDNTMTERPGAVIPPN